MNGELRLANIKETARLLRVSYQTAWRLIKAGELPAVRIGGQWRIDLGALEEWFERQLSQNGHRLPRPACPRTTSSHEARRPRADAGPGAGGERGALMSGTKEEAI